MSEFRLPQDVVPRHYDLTIRTDLPAKQYRGFVNIRLGVEQETKKIVFNALDINVGDGSVLVDEDNILVPIGQAEDKASQRVTFYYPTALPVGKDVTLRITFFKTMNTQVEGYYLSSYEDPGKWFSMTFLAAISARKYFPCWDEPSLKATFTVSMVSASNTVNLSNTSVESEYLLDADATVDNFLFSGDETLEGWKVTQFMKTPRMSTYLVATANGNFEFTEAVYKSPISGVEKPCRVYATPRLVKETQDTANHLARCVAHYEELFSVEYPLPKLDLLVAQNHIGGMENWGLIGCDIRSSIMNEKLDLHSRKIAAYVVNHEVGHQWFGNITTMNWWTDTWLNEGFATLAGWIFSTSKMYPEWNLPSYFAEQYQTTLELDAKPSSHPIRVEIDDPALIDQIFDSMSYGKAASVLRMLSDHIGEKDFVRAVGIYLAKFAYSNAEAQDLWDTLSEVARLNVSELMDPWVSRIGFPVVEVKEGGGGLALKQSKFSDVPSGQNTSDGVWPIPLSIVLKESDGSRTVKRVIFGTKEDFIPLDISTFVKINADNIGFYRTLYEPGRLEKLSQTILTSPDALTSFERSGLVYDVMTMAKANLGSIGDGLTLISKIASQESEAVVWTAIANNLNTLRNVWFEHAEVIDLLDQFQRELLRPAFTSVGYEPSSNETPETATLRVKLLKSLVLAKDSAILDNLSKRFEHYKSTGDIKTIPTDIADIVLTAGVIRGGEAAHTFLLNMLREDTLPIARSLFVESLCGSTNTQIVDATLGFILSDDFTTSDCFYFWRGLNANISARKKLADFTLTNFDTIYHRAHGGLLGGVMLDAIVKGAFGGLASSKDYDRIKSFFHDKDTAGDYRLALSSALSAISSSIQYIEASCSAALWPKHSHTATEIYTGPDRLVGE
ncbi:peptidase family M1-domain-containing protein [Flagelloscypha sp. PMI_526]|nr:peptidase family M1-domain-containing protein [Flagelloscypha sp. PMI_526]